MQSPWEENEPAWRKVELAISRRRTQALCCTLLAMMLFLVVCLRSRPLPHYVLVLDSGSTGTRIYAYTWQERARQLPLLTPIGSSAARNKVPRRQAGDKRAYKRVETEPGLDHYIKDAKGLVEKAMAPLLDWAEAVIPQARWRETPIFLLATAGLRVLPLEHQENVLGGVRHILHACPFRFRSSWARVISGEQEGIYGWIALNYVNGYLSPHPFLARRAVSQETDMDAAMEELAEGQTVQAADEGLKTVGSLDLGGSSLEVTFVPGKLKPENLKANVSILGVRYSLFTQAHHDYGLNNGFDRSVSILLEQPEAMKEKISRGWAERNVRVEADRRGTVDYRSGLQAASADQEPLITGKQAHLLKSGVRKRRHLMAANTQLQAHADHIDSSEPMHKLRLDGEAVVHGNSQILQEDVSVTESFESSGRKLGLVDRTLQQESEDQLLVVNHPCLHSGYEMTYRRGLTGAEADPARVHLVGKPNWQACEKLAGLVVNGSRSCSELPCALGKFQPFTSQPLFALTGFHVVFHFFGLEPTASLDELQSKGQRFCDTEWEAISARRGTEVHVDHYCFRVPYMIKLLREGLKLNEAQIRIGSGNEAWPLGAALAEGGKVGAGLERPQLLSPGFAFGAAGTVLLLWSVILAMVWTRSSSGLHPSYSFERKASGPGHNLPLPKSSSSKSLHGLQKSLPRPFSGSLHSGGKETGPLSPTAVIGGGNFNANVARLSSQSNQRKRVASLEDLTSMR